VPGTFFRNRRHELRVETRRALALLDLVLELEPAGSSRKRGGAEETAGRI